MGNLLILGAGGHGKVVADIANLLGRWEKICFLDDNVMLNSEINGYNVIGDFSNVATLSGSFQDAFVAIGSNKARLNWQKSLKEYGYTIPSIVHPSSYVGSHSEVGEGTIIKPHASIDTSVYIGNGCIINSNTSIGHDSIIGDGIHMSPGARVGGMSRIGTGSWLCMNSTVSNNLNIGEFTVVAAGSVVLRDLPSKVMAAGIPAIIKKYIGDE